jgi:predicted nucleotidyltransferase
MFRQSKIRIIIFLRILAKVKNFILFGSQVKGTPRKDNNVDVAFYPGTADINKWSSI